MSLLGRFVGGRRNTGLVGFSLFEGHLALGLGLLLLRPPLLAQLVLAGNDSDGLFDLALHALDNSVYSNFGTCLVGDSTPVVAAATTLWAKRSLSGRWDWRSRCAVRIPGLFGPKALWMANLAVFVVGGIVTGAGGGRVFRGALVAAGSAAPPESRAEVLAGFFLGAYIGLSVPVIGLGIATTYAPARDVMLVFVVLVAIAVTLSVRAVIRHTHALESSH